MALFLVNRRNPYNFPPGAHFERTDEGFQRAKTEVIDNRIKIVSTYGIIYSAAEVQEYMLRVGAKRFSPRESVIIGGRLR